VTPTMVFLSAFFAKAVMLPLVTGIGAAIQRVTRSWCVEWRRDDYLRAAVVASATGALFIEWLITVHALFGV
jgi:hypothetical protein